jgi:hypothetical protein
MEQAHDVQKAEMLEIRVGKRLVKPVTTGVEVCPN